MLPDTLLLNFRLEAGVYPMLSHASMVDMCCGPAVCQVACVLLSLKH